jgi:hypothetical protein
MELEYSPSMIFFTWAGFDEMDEVSGSGSAELDGAATSKSSYPSVSAMTPFSRLAASDFFNNLLDLLVIADA